MTILPLPYKPTGAWWRRVWQAMATAFVNLKVRSRERRERGHEERLEHWKRTEE